MFKEFKAFILRGNVFDLAVGVIIGGAFGGITTSLVSDIIMPLVGIVFQADFSNLYIPLSEKVKAGLPLVEAKKLGPVLAWGNFVTIIINFVILAFVIFMMVKAVNKLVKKEAAAPAPPAEPTASEVLLSEIRDLLKK
ncbi:MAG: large conductance mechanosensitive channel protein MscL [Bacteroidetes bacterium]|nr:MAG: large conductance mechanosensitive channel protein MscL [Bacteroidota bacterium]TAG92108.1 MAG: large conductance mechanosensitive channel protein MscL [Bacteroidota bacterium]